MKTLCNSAEFRTALESWLFKNCLFRPKKIWNISPIISVFFHGCKFLSFFLLFSSWGNFCRNSAAVITLWRQPEGVTHSLNKVNFIFDFSFLYRLLPSPTTDSGGLAAEWQEVEDLGPKTLFLSWKGKREEIQLLIMHGYKSKCR